LQDGGQEELVLKNGGRIEASLGQALLRALEGLLEQAPHHFRALHAIAEGRSSEAPPESVSALKDAHFLRPDGTAIPGLADVVVSAYQQTRDGPVLINPFQLETLDQVRALERMEQEGRLRLAHEIRKRTEGDGKGRVP